MTLYWPAEMGDWLWDGESMIWPGGAPDDLEQLWSAAPIDGENLLMPEGHGRLPRDWFIEEQQLDVRYLLSGLVLPDGEPASNPAEGIAANYAHLVDIVGSPLTWTGSTVETIVTRSDGATLTGDVQGFVSRLGAREGSVCRCSVTVVIPAGALAVSEGS